MKVMPKGFDYRKVYKKVQTVPFHLAYALRYPDEVITSDGREVQGLMFEQGSKLIFGKVSGIEMIWDKQGKFKSGLDLPIDIYLKPDKL